MVKANGAERSVAKWYPLDTATRKFAEAPQGVFRCKLTGDPSRNRTYLGVAAAESRTHSAIARATDCPFGILPGDKLVIDGDGYIVQAVTVEKSANPANASLAFATDWIEKNSPKTFSLA